MELSEMIEAVDLVEFISQYTELEEKNGEYWGLSPLKDEATPSFSVRRETNSFYDFASGVGGNVITFLKFYFKCSGAEAVNKLKEYIGFTGKITRHRKISAVEIAGKYKKPKKTAKTKKSVILEDDYMLRYETKPDKLAVWEAEGISAETLKTFQVYYDSFSDRLVYPIRNISGQIVNIGGRTLDPMWKEKKLRKYTYFKSWGEMNTIYGIAENMEAILKKREVILFEGAKSVMLAHTWGIENAGAILTSHVNPNQMRILAKLGCDVVFALDKDVAIREDHNIKKLKQLVNVKYLWDRQNLLGEKDAPVDKGLDVWNQLYEERQLWK